MGMAEFNLRSRNILNAYFANSLILSLILVSHRSLARRRRRVRRFSRLLVTLIMPLTRPQFSSENNLVLLLGSCRITLRRLVRRVL